MKFEIKQAKLGAGANWIVYADGKAVRGPLWTREAARQWVGLAQRYGLEDRRLYRTIILDGVYQ